MNKTRAAARDYAALLGASSVARSAAATLFVIPPFTAIADVAAILGGTRVRVGAQNMHWADAGAWTGEISPPMIKDCGATLVEIGHSERRRHFGETDETVALKTRAAIDHELLALVCVGETAQEHAAGRTGEVLTAQVEKAIALIDPIDHRSVMIAYEPVWSIGDGGVPADPDFADRQHELIKRVTRARLGVPLVVLYGGSVNPGNAEELAARPHIDGLFIGRSASAVDRASAPALRPSRRGPRGRGAWPTGSEALIVMSTRRPSSATFAGRSGRTCATVTRGVQSGLGAGTCRHSMPR
jgi:triosephosphate isomerase